MGGWSRTRWAETHVENLIAPAFVAEFVFRSLQVLDFTQREVADFLVLRGNQAILVSQKCQDDPTSRMGEKLRRWTQKRTEEAVAQLKGALRRVGLPNQIWCDHRRRGRVLFPDGLPPITHAIATVEAFEHVNLGGNLPLEHQGTPISYLSVNDFVNVCQQLRTVPEMVNYLDARRSLPASVLLSVGAEQTIFSYYLLFNGDVSGFASVREANALLRARIHDLSALFAAKEERDRYAIALEHVADQLSGRHVEYREGLSQTVLDRYEPTGERRAYLRMQDHIAGMSLAERAELGRAFDDVVRRRREDRGGAGFAFVAAMIDSQADSAFVLGSFGETSTFSRNDLLSCFDTITRAAMAYYGRARSMIIVDRDGKSYEVGINELTSPVTDRDLEVGRNVFGALRVFSKELHFRPYLTRI
jgi:hypothetical protein